MIHPKMQKKKKKNITSRKVHEQNHVDGDLNMSDTEDYLSSEHKAVSTRHRQDNYHPISTTIDNIIDLTATAHKGIVRDRP